MKAGIWIALGVAGLLGFSACGGSESDPAKANTGGTFTKTGGASATAAGGAASGGAKTGGASVGGTGGAALSTACPTVEPLNDDACNGIVPDTRCNYTQNACVCGRNNEWDCADLRCPAAAARPNLGEACVGLDGVHCTYSDRNVCDCNAGVWACLQTQPRRCPKAQPANGDACPGRGGTFCDYNSAATAQDVSSAGAAGTGIAGAAGASGGTAGAPANSAGGVASGGVLNTGGSASSLGGAGNTAGAAAAVACGCSPQTQKWICF